MQENQRKFCRVCGKEMLPTALFCSECSTPVNGNYIPKQTKKLKMPKFYAPQDPVSETIWSVVSFFCSVVTLPVVLFVRMLVQETYTVYPGMNGAWRTYEATRVPEDLRGYLLAMAITMSVIAVMSINTEKWRTALLRLTATILTFLISLIVIYIGA